MRVLVLMHEDGVPPRSIAGLTEQQVRPFRMEFDVTNAVQGLGHEVLALGLADDLRALREALDRFRPRITVNLLEDFHGVRHYDLYVVGFLELMKRRYTGCNPRGLMLAHDKALSQKILAYHRIPVPDFAVFPLGHRFRMRRGLSFPLFVKSATEEGSEGIAQASIVHSEQQLRERVEFIHDKILTDAMAESYIDGRELYVGVLGNGLLRTLPIWELRFTKVPEHAPRVATSRVKWNPAYQERHGIVWGPAEGLPAGTAERIRRTCKRVYRALSLTGCARIDLRLAADGRFYVLEANPNPDLAGDGELAESAAAGGLPYPDLIDRLLRLGLGYRAGWSD